MGPNTVGSPAEVIFEFTPGKPAMLERSAKSIAFAFFVAAIMFASGCLTTIDDACSTAATDHCTNCFSCAGEVDGVSGAQLCDLTDGEAASTSECEDVLTERCKRQARVLQDPFDELEECEDAVNTDTCDDLVEREVLDQPAAPAGCGRFL